MSESHTQCPQILDNHVDDYYRKLELDKLPTLAEIVNTKRAPPSTEELAHMPKVAAALMAASSNAAYIRTSIGVLLNHIMEVHKSTTIEISPKGHWIFRNGKKAAAVMSAGTIIRSILPILDQSIAGINALSPETLRQFDRKQVSIGDVAFVAASVYTATKSVSPTMAVAMKLGSFCNLKDAIWSLKYEMAEYKKIECSISTNVGKKGDVVIYAFGNRLPLEFKKPRGLATLIETTTIKTDDEYDEVDDLFDKLTKKSSSKSKPKDHPSASDAGDAAEESDINSHGTPVAEEDI
jgi:hypothetical protein